MENSTGRKRVCTGRFSIGLTLPLARIFVGSRMSE